MIAPNQLMVRDDLLAVFAAANANAKIPHRPFTPNHFVPPREVNDRGEFNPATTYNFGDQVSQNGYQFVAQGTLTGVAPLNDALNPELGWSQPWQSCLQRLRDAVNEGASDLNNGVRQHDKMVSGPWPCGLPDVNYRNVEFYFADTGGVVTVSLSGSKTGTAGTVGQEVAVPANGTFTLAQTHLPLPNSDGTTGNRFPVTNTDTGDGEATTATTDGQPFFEYTNTSEIKIAIGGTEPIQINATLQVGSGIIQGLVARDSFTDGNYDGFTITPDATDPTGLVTVDTSGFLPGQTFTPSIQSGNLLLTCVVNGTFNPGIYTVRFSSARGPNNRASGVETVGGSAPNSGFNEWAFDTFAPAPLLMTLSGSAGWSSTDAVEVPGVHDTKRVLKISAPPYNQISGLPSGLWVGEAYYKLTNPQPSDPNTPFVGGQQTFYQIPDTGNPTPLTFVLLDYLDTFGLAYSATTDGYWTAITPPVRSLGLIPFDKMPWNILPVTSAGDAAINNFLKYIPPYKNGEGFDGITANPAYGFGDGPAWAPGSNSNEELPWPKKWKPRVHYPSGYGIQDANGNLQQCIASGRSDAHEPAWPSTEGAVTQEPTQTGLPAHTEPGARWNCVKVFPKKMTINRNQAYALDAVGWDDNGNRQKVTTAGTTDADAPMWSKSVGGVTADGTVQWTLIRVQQIAPAVAHLTPTLFPVYWQNPVAPQTDPIPDLSNGIIINGQHPYEFDPRGWFIGRVSLNRIPQTKSTDKPPSDPIQVNLGCIRNGAFVSFGIYQTDTQFMAFWPVFTKNTPICYQSAERIDVQASVLTCGLAYATWGAVDFPYAAAYVTDVQAVAGLLH